jgi:hypothetical protein
MHEVSDNDELNEALQKLYETEMRLKREQDEKQLLELKFQEQKQHHDQQLNTIINRYVLLLV